MGEVATRVEALTGEVDEAHVLFNNNQGDYALRAAERFRKLLGQEVVAPPSSLPPPRAVVIVARPP